MRLFFSSLLFFLAGAAIGVWGWSVVRQKLDQKHDEEVFDRQRTAAAAPATKPAPSQPATKATKETKAGRGDVVARLSIQKIHLRAMVREGSDDETLDVALGHIPGTALPGQRGNVGVAGHRDTIFRHLAEVGRDDQIQLQTPSKTYVYQVDDMAIVKPEAVSVLTGGRDSRLTLVTCYPFNYIGSAPKRYIVKAHLVSHADSATDTTSDSQR